MLEITISVIMPVFNATSYLSDAIESVLDQTHKPNEIIVVNDGSTDNGSTSKTISKYSNYVKVVNKSNGGCGSALNAGIRQMTSSHFAWLSHDDLYLSNHLQELTSVLEDSGKLDSIVFGNWYYANEKLEILGSRNLGTELNEEIQSNPFAILAKSLINGCSLLVPIEKLHFHGLFNEKLPTTQDYAMWRKLFPVSQFVNSPTRSLISRQHSEQDSIKVKNHTAEADLEYLQLISEMMNSNYSFSTKKTIVELMQKHLEPSNYSNSKRKIYAIYDEISKSDTLDVGKYK